MTSIAPAGAPNRLLSIAKAPFRPIKRFLMRARYTLGSERYCPVCKRSSRRFMPFGRGVLREDARCVHCGSLERMRFVWLYFEKCTDLLDGRPKRMLHVAPEQCLRGLLRRELGKQGGEYITADLCEPDVDVRMDLTQIRERDNSYDVIYCSHVLEHIPDDRRAMRELHRVLKPGRWAVLLVPVKGETTDEDPTITDPAERLRRFGLEDHVRQYGRDYVQRLREAGFRVTTTYAPDLFTQREVTRFGIGWEAGEIYFCTK